MLFVDHVESILGGAEINLLELLTAPREIRDWKTAVACPRSGPLAETVLRSGHTHFDYRLPEVLRKTRVAAVQGAPGVGWLSAVRGMRAVRRAGFRLARIANHWSADVVISCSNKDHLASCFCMAPKIWWANDALTADFFSWPVRRIFSLGARAFADHLVTVSDFARSALSELGIPSNRLHTIHNGIDLRRYRRGPRGALRRRHGIPLDAPLVGWIGRVTPWKGPDFFVDLARSWISQRPDGHFLLAGGTFNEDSAFARDLRTRIEDPVLRGRVHQVGFMDSVSEVLTDLDVLVHCSLRPEPFGRVLIEAMALGVPVVAARAGGVPEIVEHGVNGLLAEPGDARDYLGRVGRLISEPKFATRLTAAASETVRNRFQLERVASDFNTLISGIAAAQR